MKKAPEFSHPKVQLVIFPEDDRFSTIFPSSKALALLEFQISSPSDGEDQIFEKPPHIQRILDLSE